MAVTTPAPRIGKMRPRPADSEKLPANARFHVASEMDAPTVKMPRKRAAKGKARRGLINRTVG